MVNGRAWLTLTTPRRDYGVLRLALAGQHQVANATAAVRLLELLGSTRGFRISPEAIVAAVEDTIWPARLETITVSSVEVLLDGAHNPGGARLLAETWRQVFGDRRATLILAVLQDKDAAGICRALAPVMHRALLPAIRSARALPPEELRLTMLDELPDRAVATTASFADAWSEAREDPAPILITGSLHFAGEALAFLDELTAALEDCLQ